MSVSIFTSEEVELIQTALRDYARGVALGDQSGKLDEIYDLLDRFVGWCNPRRSLAIDTSHPAPLPGVMHPVDQAFYDLTIKQRDAAWAHIEIRDETIRKLNDELTELKNKLLLEAKRQSADLKG